MIVRILSEGQYEVDDAHLASLEVLDEKLQAAIEAGDEGSFRTYLEQMIGSVRRDGTAVTPGIFVTSDLTLPHENSTLHEVRDLLASGETPES
jgi:hypothetical protein